MAITQEFIRSIDWAKTPIGPMKDWPRSLRSFVAMILELPSPAIIFWGPEQTQLYNDGYAVIMGPRHPRYFGGTYRECWPDTYPTIIPWMRQVLEEGKFIEVKRTLIPLTRYGFNEEAHFTFTFSPLRDDEGRVAGVYQPVLEVTDEVLRERRAETLRELSTRADVRTQAARAFAANRNDLPFTALYLWKESSARLELEVQTGFSSQAACSAALAPIAHALKGSFEKNAAERLEIAPVAAGPWPEPVSSVYLLPIRRSLADESLGVIAFGISPRLRFDADYREFLEGVSQEVGRNLAAQNAARLEAEWKEREQNARRDAAQKLASRLSLLFEHAPVGIAVLTGPEHVFEVSNPRYAALLPQRKLMNRPIREALPELEGQGIYELLDSVYETGIPYMGRSVRLTIDRGDGLLDERFFDFVYQPVPDESGKTESIIVVVFETTELTRANEAAEAANRTKDEFFAILGHELRNPLAPIVASLELMRLRGDKSLLHERTMIERQVEHITRLVDDLLDVSRITRGMVELKHEPVEVAEVVAKALEMAGPLFDERQQRLNFDIPDRLVVEGDAVRLAQVISNLLNNASKYTQPGGSVRISAERRGARVRIVVADNGQGISAEMLPRVFEPFAQEKQSIERAQSGLGLGLAIVRNLVKLHDGTVTAASDGPGRGSRFVVDLPLSEATVTLPPPAAAPKSSGLASEPYRLLIVDDNEDAAEMFALSLDLLGYETRVAHNGRDALRVAAEFSPHVALLDIGLPIVDGYEVARRLRANQGDRIKLIAVTGYGQSSDRERTKEAGFDAHLVKPVHLQAVIDLVTSYRRAPSTPA